MYKTEDYKNALIRLCQDKVNADDVRLLESLIEENDRLKKHIVMLDEENKELIIENDQLLERVKSLDV